MKRSTFFLLFVGIHIFTPALYAGDWFEKSDENRLSLFSPESESVLFDPERWTFQFGIAIITENVVDDFSVGRIDRAKGAAGGEMYLFSASYHLYDFDWNFREWRFRPQLELPLVFGVVNERGRSPFFDYNAAITLRWKDFPFNRFVYTNIESGVGLSYTDHVLATEQERHPERDRSHLKFYWPIQLMLAHPQRKEHQLVLFIHHQSGGHIFDVGGSNLIGIGYRYVFRER
ncbi:MAG TPA: hypothetical protein PKV75_01890 [Desulfobacterales bacterium]|nr:hypothetical protein [Desulfobacterales bacterium]